MLSAPLRPLARVEPRYVYSASDPPDALWIFGSRASAEAVLTTYSRVAACALAPSCCDGTFQGLHFYQSWFPQCWAVRRTWDAGVRLVADPNISGTVLLHTGGGRPGTHDLQDFPTTVVTTFLDPGATGYDAHIHARPDDADARMCGPWKPDPQKKGHAI